MIATRSELKELNGSFGSKIVIPSSVEIMVVTVTPTFAPVVKLPLVSKNLRRICFPR